MTPLPPRPRVRPAPPAPTAPQTSHQPSPSEVAEEAPGAAGASDDANWRIERLVAGRWYAIGGALIVTIGVALFFKLALDRGWLTFSPAARCLAGAAFGLVMLGAGEWLRRRRETIAGVFRSQL
jgi:uncharacterized membrane protein